MNYYADAVADELIYNYTTHNSHQERQRGKEGCNLHTLESTNLGFIGWEFPKPEWCRGGLRGGPHLFHVSYILQSTETVAMATEA